MNRGLLVLCLFGLLLGSLSAQDLDPALAARVPYTVLEQGYGREARLGDTLAIDYSLRLEGEQGEVVDSTEGRSPMLFEMGSQNFIPGLTLGLRGVKRGEVRSFSVPPEFGYGERQIGPIPANSALFFEVRVVKIIEPGKDEEELSEIFGLDGSGSRRHASQIDVPAVQEYLIRDFFTRPWRYPDASERIWRQNAGVTLALVVVLIGALLGRKRREP